MMFWPSIQISPASGRIRPIRFLSRTLFPPPLRPMMTSVSPVATLRSTPRRISCAPMRFSSPRTAIMGEGELRSSGGVRRDAASGRELSTVGASLIFTLNSQPQLSTSHYQPAGKMMFSIMVRKKFEDQNRERRIDHRFGRRPSHADRALAAVQSFVTADKNDQNREAKCFRQAHDNVAHLRPTYHVRHVIWPADLEQMDRRQNRTVTIPKPMHSATSSGIETIMASMRGTTR